MKTIKKINFIKIKLREWFHKQNFIEVETPALVPAYTTEPYLAPFITQHDALKTDTKKRKGKGKQNSQTLFLIPSPEFYLKRLLVDEDFEKVFELAKCFRNEESLKSPIHNPEFTMLEWYEKGADYKKLMDDFESLVKNLSESLYGHDVVSYNYKMHNLKNWKRIPIQRAFLEHAGIDFSAFKSWNDLKKEGERLGYSADSSLDEIFYLIFLNHVDPKTVHNGPVTFYDYPSFQAGFLTTKQIANLEYSERFESWLGGMEICNAGSELCDSAELKKRIKHNNAMRKEKGLPIFAHDEEIPDIFAAVKKAAGIAIGFDRLVMFLLDQRTIANVRMYTFAKDEEEKSPDGQPPSP